MEVDNRLIFEVQIVTKYTSVAAVVKINCFQVIVWDNR